MIETHVAAFTSLRLACLLNRKGMTRVTGIACCRAKLRSTLAQFGDLCRGLHADLVASTAALFALDHRHGLPVDRGHRLHCGPGKRMLSLLVLRDLVRVTIFTGIWSGYLDFGNIRRCGVLIPVAHNAPNIGLAVLAQLPVGDDVGSRLAVAFNALRIG